MGCVTVVGMVFGFSAWYFGEQLLSIYITDSPTATAYGMVRLSPVSYTHLDVYKRQPPRCFRPLWRL